jgi:hypothetical protein
MKVFMRQVGSHKLVLSKTANSNLEGVFRTQCNHLQEIITESPYWQHTFWKLEQPERERQEREQWQAYELPELKPFFEECCVLVPGARAGATPLYEAYKKWAATKGIKDCLTQKGFGNRLRKKFPVEPGRNARYINIGLKEGPEGVTFENILIWGLAALVIIAAGGMLAIGLAGWRDMRKRRDK